MNLRLILITAAAALLTACGTTKVTYRMSDPEVTRVVEGIVVSAEVIKKDPPVTVMGTAATGIGAANVGNSTVGALSLLASVLDSAAEDTNLYSMNLVVLDDKTQKEETIVFKRLLRNRTAPDKGDRVRIIFRTEDEKIIANLTKYPQLDAATR